MARNDENTIDVLSNAGDNAIDLINRLDVATGKVQPGKRRGSIIKAAQNNVFEFPVFVSNSIPIDYAESIVALLEQNYATYLQMAISMNPVVSASSVKNGLQFADYKTNTNKYLEYTELDFQHEACHNVIQEGGLQFEFDMLTIDDFEARLINEAVDYQPLSEFDHFFQEAEVSRNDMLTLYPYPTVTAHGIQVANLPGNHSPNAHIEFNVIDPANVRFGTLTEIAEYLDSQNLTQNQIQAALENMDNTLTYYHIPTLSNYDIHRNTSQSDTVQMGYVRDVCGSMTLDEFKDQRNTSLRQMVNDLDSRNPGFRSSMFATMRAVEQTVDNANQENQRLNAQIAQLKASAASSNASAAKTNLDISDIPDAPTYTDAIAAHRRAEVAKADPELIDAQKRSAIAKANIDEQNERKATMSTNYNGLGTITPEDLEAIERQYSKEQLAKLIRDNKDLTYTDSNGRVHTISADDVAAAQRASILARSKIDEQNASAEMLDAAKRSAIARASVDERNAYKATSPYYRRLDAIDTTAGTVGRVASAADQTARAISNIATLPSNIRHARNQVELDKQNIAINKNTLDNLDKDRALKKSEIGSKLKNDIQYVDDSKCQKLNTMKPLLMKTTVNILNKDDSLQPVNYVIGVKCHTRVIPSSILPEVAKYPLKEMDKISRKVKWRAGELKFMKDLVFRIKEKKQTAADSRDPNRKWYRRLYELAHMKGDAPAAAVVQGKSIFATFIRDKQGKSKMMHGMIPNASIIVSKADVDNVKRMTEIDLLKDSTARNFCGELFLISFIVVDTDAGKMMHMMPDEGSTFNVMSMNSVEKQLATLNTAGTKTKEMFKLLG